MAKPMTTAQREIIRKTLDDPMTDEEAIELIVIAVP